MKIVTVLIVIQFICALNVNAEESEAPDFASMDKAVLVILCENQYNEINRLRAEIDKLKQQIATGHGGSAAIVDGNITAVNDGSWTVTIRSVSATDVAPYENEIAALRLRLNGEVIASTYNRVGHQTDGVEDRLRQAEQDLQRMMQRGKYKNKVNSSGRTITTSSNLDGYTDKELNDAKAVIRRLQGEKNGIDRKILDLERRIETERNTINALGTTEDSIPVTLIASGVYAHIGQTLEVDRTYTVTGRGVFKGASGEITLKTAVPVSASEKSPG